MARRLIEKNLSKENLNSLNDCKKCPIIAQQIWSWARNLENWAIALLVICIILGIVAPIFYDEMELKISIPSGIVIGLAFYSLYSAAAVIVGSLASIVYNTAVSANVAIYESAKTEPQSATEPAEESVSQSTDASTSDCAADTESENTESTDEKEVTPDKSDGLNDIGHPAWNCPYCGAYNSRSFQVCWNCKKIR